MPEITIVIGMATASGATYSAAGGPIFGRERELTQLERLVDGVSECGAALLVRGEPGIGKSTLLAAASSRAEAAGMRVLRTTGVQSEARLPFAGLHQLVLPVLDRAEHLPVPQRTALLAAFGLVEAEVTDRFLAALALLELLSAPLCQAAPREAACKSSRRLLKTASETRRLRHRSASFRDLPSASFLR
jgi:hypothetical protein